MECTPRRFCGIDWASDHHDIAVIDSGGRLVAKARLDHNAEGWARFLEILAEAGDRAAAPIPVAIETDKVEAYAGSAPVTRASGKKTVVSHRQVKNRRLNAVGPIWTLTILRSSTGAREHYQRRRDRGDWHRQAQRHLFNRLLGCLWHCLQTRTLFEETHAFPPPLALAA